MIDWDDAYTQALTVIEGGETGILAVSGGATGSKGMLLIKYDANQDIGAFTGIMWANGTTPVLSGATGYTDTISTVFDGEKYIGNTTLGHTY